MLVILVTVDSQGLKTSADIVAQTIRKGLADKAEVATIIVPEYLTFQTADANDQALLIHKRVDVVIFLERLLAHTRLRAARHRILIPNPEKTAEHVVASIPGLHRNMAQNARQSDSASCTLPQPSSLIHRIHLT